MGLKFTGQVPFRDVYIHALVRDAEGQKMSKSKGNVIDPLHVMDEYGTDALRFTLASMASPGRDIKLAEERIEGYRNFANKIWNAARFILMHLEASTEQMGRSSSSPSFADRWILSRLNQTIREVTTALDLYRFDQAANRLYHFIWHEYCDWYLEMIKPALQAANSEAARQTRHILLQSFETIQRLLHPIMPFITEEIWQTLPHQGESVVTQPYPTPVADWDDKEVEQHFQVLEHFVATARTGRALLGYPPGKPVKLFAAAAWGEGLSALNDLRQYLQILTRGEVLVSSLETWPEKNVLRLPVENITVGLQVEGDVDLKKVLMKVRKQRQDNQQELSRLEGKLTNPEFLVKAPEDVRKELSLRKIVLSQDGQLLASSERQLEEMTR
jgi:valyl-tRNA synthetase